jgi:dipeptidyl aminopeptidase/acylaminoacyl peptidase
MFAQRALAGLVLGAGVCGAAAQPAQANWRLASQFSTSYIRQYLYSTSLTPGFINETDQFWYQWRDSKGVRFWRVNPRSKKREPLFDSAHMATLLSEALKRPYDATNLPIGTLAFEKGSETVFRFTVENTQFSYNTETKELKNLGRPERTETPSVENPAFLGRTGGGSGGGGQSGGAREFRNFSPDRKSFVYALDHNLYYVDVVDGKEGEPIQLTKDGERDYSFGSRAVQDELRRMMQQDNDDENTNQSQQGQGRAQTDNEQRVRVSVTWSKDSERFFVIRTDSRKVKDLFLVNSLSTPRPSLMTYKYSMPGEPDVPQQELLVFSRASKMLDKFDVGKWKDQRISDLHFQDKSTDVLRFVRRDRLQRNLELCDLDLKSKEVKLLLSESVENAFLEFQPVRYVKAGGDFLWFSERTGWGHYYLYSNEGKFKNAVTSGPFRANNIAALDGEKGRMWFNSFGREEDQNPYYRHLYRVNLNGKDLTLLDPGDADMNSALSPSRSYVVTVGSRTDLEPFAQLRDDEGRLVLDLEKTDLSRLYQTGWKMPSTFKVKAADGVTDIYGNMWLPFDFDPNRKYAVIANVYPGPQTESVSTSFSATAGNQRLAQLGFVVIQIGNRGGNPARSNAYHSYGYYNLRDYGLADKKAGIEQLASQHSFIDIDRVGIYGHSGGGFMSAAALLLPPFNEFFKVGVASAGNHDNNVYNQNWSEQHHGLREVPITPPASTTGQGRGTGRPEMDEDWLMTGDPFAQGTTTGTRFDIKVPTNAELAANLKGHLFLVHGDMDNNVHHAGTMRLADALIKNRKRFEFLLLPGKAHGFADMQPYFLQRMYEYFVQHLMGAPTPPGVDMTIMP